MDPVRITLPQEIPHCGFTQEPVVDAVTLICEHFFEKERFEAFGGSRCILCNREITWYADVPKNHWGKEVTLQKKPPPIINRPAETHVDHQALEVGIARNLVMIACAHGDEAFENWCVGKESSIPAELNYDRVLKEGWIQGLKRYPLLVEKLFSGFNYTEYETVQAFINAFLKEQNNFEIYNFLIKQVLVDRVHEGVHLLYGQSTLSRPIDEREIIAGAEGGKKLRALLGLAFSVCIIFGLRGRLKNHFGHLKGIFFP